MKTLCILLAVSTLAVHLQAATKTATFEVNGWTCGSCAAATRIALKKLDGIEDVRTDPEKKEALVTYDDAKITPDKMVDAIARLGYKAMLKSGATTAGSRPAESKAAPIAAPGASPSLDRVGFFEVPLECGAAEDLGCGSAAKPVLSELDKDPKIASARINHPGTLLAVTWKSPTDRSDSAVEALFEKHKLAAGTLKGKERERAIKEFQTEQWYGASDVDRLSEHEARVISARLVNRARLDMTPNRRAALTEELAVVFARHLTLSDEECDSRREVIEQELTKAASKYLNPEQLAELRKAGEQGIHALPGEDK